MANETSRSTTHPGWRGNYLLMQSAREDAETLGRDPEAAHRGAEHVGRNVGHAAPTDEHRSDEGAGMMPPWMRTLIKVWKGELTEEEKKRSKEVQEDFRESLRCGKAMLDGEEFWLMPECRNERQDAGGK